AILKYENNSSEGANLEGVVFDHIGVYDVPVDQGRFFTEQEIIASRNVALIGVKIARALVPNGSALGKEIKIKGQKFGVSGMLEAVGEGLFHMPSKDAAAFIPYRSFNKMF